MPRKLGIKPDHLVLLDGQPAGVDLGDLGAARVVRRLPLRADVTITFHTSYVDLAVRLPDLVGRTTPAGMVWVCWTKKQP